MFQAAIIGRTHLPHQEQVVAVGEHDDDHHERDAEGHPKYLAESMTSPTSTVFLFSMSAA